MQWNDLRTHLVRARHERQGHLKSAPSTRGNVSRRQAESIGYESEPRSSAEGVVKALSSDSASTPTRRRALVRGGDRAAAALGQSRDPRDEERRRQSPNSLRRDKQGFTRPRGFRDARDESALQVRSASRRARSTTT